MNDYSFLKITSSYARDVVQRLPFCLFDLRGEVALVVDPRKGIGNAVACTLAEGGAEVVISSRKQ